MAAYLRPLDLQDALAALGGGRARVIAGGTDLYPTTQAVDLAGDLIDLSALRGMRGMVQTDAGLRIGALTTWADLIAAPLPPALRALQQAAVQVGGCQIQNAGTIGGNLCNASPAADGVPPLLAVDAVVELASVAGTRHMALGDFLQGPRQTARRVDEVLTAVLIPPAGLGGAAHFIKLGARAHLVISIAMVAVRLTVEHGRIVQAALAVGACSATARRLLGVEAALIGQSVADARVDAGAISAALSPMDDLRATADYRAHAAAVLVQRAVAQLCKDSA